MTTSRRALFDKLDLTPFRALESATALAKPSGTPCIEPVHRLHQRWQTGLHAQEGVVAQGREERAQRLAEATNRLRQALRKVFPAAFLGRMSAAPHLSRSDVREQHDIAQSYGSRLVQHVIASSGAHESGARRPIGFIEQRPLPQLSRHWLDAMQQRRRRITRIAVEAAPSSQDDHRGGDAIACQIDHA